MNTPSTVAPAVAARLTAAIAAARLAGAETLRWFGAAALVVDTKADQSPVTQADRAAEAILRRELLGGFPDDAFLGEETGATAGSSGYEWIVDPIDGTKSFIRGVPLYATLVGCRHEGRGVLGVIAIPALDEIVHAARGGGAWHTRAAAEPVAARVSSRTMLRESLLCSSDFTSFARWSGGRPAGVAARERLEEACGVVRTWGDGYGYLLVATGRGDVMVDPLLNAWDAAAVDVVVTEAGGTFTDWRGRDSIESGDGVASNGRVHSDALRLLSTAMTWLALLCGVCTGAGMNHDQDGQRVSCRA
ncbi:MAG: inositol monophosphatase [Planctomycetia bacterium]|nr:inositol monophosphatase [Planctomycetia bacterium]